MGALGATYEEFLKHLNLPDGGDDAVELYDTLDAATVVAEVDEECGIGPIVQRDLTFRVSARTGLLMLPWTPAAALVSLTGARNTRSYTLDELDLDTSTGIVRAMHGRLDDGAYDVTYTAGRFATVDDVSANIRLAVCIIGKHLWETQRGRGASRMGKLATSMPPDEKVPLGFLIPHRARSLLAGEVDWVPLA